MIQFLVKARSVQFRIAALTERAQQVQQQANSSEWPYSSLTDEVRLFTRQLVETANSMLVRAGKEVCLPLCDIAVPLTDRHAELMAGTFARQAADKATRPQAVSAVSFASSDCYIGIAETLVARAEACVRGDQTIAGARIAHGELWNK